jgi:hypothetical protein
MAQMSREELLHNLMQFTGTTQWYRHPLFRTCLYTDGIQFLAEKAECYWLLDHIFANQALPKVKAEPFQTWTITLLEEGCEIVVDNGNGKVIKKWKIPFTTFPLDEQKLYFTDNVLLLPSEN